MSLQNSLTTTPTDTRYSNERFSLLAHQLPFTFKVNPLSKHLSFASLVDKSVRIFKKFPYRVRDGTTRRGFLIGLWTPGAKNNEITSKTQTKKSISASMVLKCFVFQEDFTVTESKLFIGH